jgi:hypothetical protein
MSRKPGPSGRETLSGPPLIRKLSATIDHHADPREPVRWVPAADKFDKFQRDGFRIELSCTSRVTSKETVAASLRAPAARYGEEPPDGLQRAVSL